MADVTADADVRTPGMVEERIAAFAAGCAWEDIPDSVRHEAKRSLLNMLATSFAGCREPAIDKALAVMGAFSGPATSGVIGRTERVDMLLAAFVNAMSANIHDYDDTHPATIIHPTAPVAPALYALAESRSGSQPISGRTLLKAFILGAEIECRVGNALSPYHYARGWHITSTCGGFGAAIAAGVALGLSERQLVWALGTAAVQASGLVEALGTMSKSVSVGGAARGGLLAALLAEADFSGPKAPLSGVRGALKVYCDEPKPTCLTEGLGEVWEIATNTYKPYPVGVVLNPVIDACLELKARGVSAADVAKVELWGHPLLRQRTDRADVATGRESQVSAQHAIAVTLATGAAGLDAFDDEAVAKTLAAGRPQTVFHDEPKRDIAETKMLAHLRDGRTAVVEIEAARGSPGNPMSDADIEEKLRTLAARTGFSRDLGPLIDAIWSIDTLDDAAIAPRLAFEN